jgi:ATP-binding cassette subfamily B protein
MGQAELPGIPQKYFLKRWKYRIVAINCRKSMKGKQVKRLSKPSMMGLLKPYSALIILLVAFALLSNAVNLFIPRIIARGIDDYNNGKIIFKTIIIQFLVASVIIFIFTSLQSLVQVYASERVARDLRNQLSAKISIQSHAFIQQVNPSRLLTNLTSDIDSVKLFISMAIVSLLSSIFIIVGSSVLLLLINWRLAIVVLLIIPIIGGVFFFILSRVRALFKKSREIIDWLNKVINESILGASIIRVLNSQQLEYNKFLEANLNAKGLGLSILRLFAALIPIITFTANIGMLCILALGGHFVIKGTMTLGDFAAFTSYLSILIFPIFVIGFMSTIIAQATASYQRINQILGSEDPKESGTILGDLRGDIALKEVNLNYGEKPILKGISFFIKAGTRTAVIGPTAAGKSQLLFLLTALIRPSTGIIEFDGISMEDYKKEAFHKQIGFVFQDSIIFNMSLRENIAFSDDATDQSLEKAISTAELTEFIDSLPNKLNTIVSERGASLSGGQKQRIMLARALAIDPKILLLDDFTARVDSNTEQKILYNVRKNYPDLTLVSVTQKIASIQNFDEIILLMEGEIIAKGSHAELIHSCPEYIQIFNSQRSTSHYEL